MDPLHRNVPPGSGQPVDDPLSLQQHVKVVHEARTAAPRRSSKAMVGGGLVAIIAGILAFGPRLGLWPSRGGHGGTGSGTGSGTGGGTGSGPGTGRDTS